MRRTIFAPFAIAAFVAVGGSCTNDHTYRVQYLFASQSSVDVFVDWGSEYFYSLAAPIYVPSGDTKEILYYEEFLGSPPDAETHFTCISARRATDGVLVYQRTELENRIWRIRDLAEYRHEFTLELTNARLNANGIQNLCGQLIGTVLDSLTMAPLDRVQVVFQDSLDQYLWMRGYSDGGSDYSLVWSGDMPPGIVEFNRFGYKRKSMSAPRDVTSLGDRRYRLDMLLVPDSLP